jgi:hypothetical protein
VFLGNLIKLSLNEENNKPEIYQRYEKFTVPCPYFINRFPDIAS